MTRRQQKRQRLITARDQWAKCSADLSNAHIRALEAYGQAKIAVQLADQRHKQAWASYFNAIGALREFDEAGISR